MSEQRDEFLFDTTDFADNDSDPLKQRWHQSVRQSIRRLTPAKAEVVSAILLDYTSRRGYRLSEEYFSTVELLATDADESSAEPWLLEHAPDTSQEVLVAYGGTPHVYLTTWGVFSAHWDDFCYPSSDDVVICPLTEEWVLYFYHEEVLFWGKPKRRARGRLLKST